MAGIFRGRQWKRLSFLAKTFYKTVSTESGTVTLYANAGYGGREQVLPEDSKEFSELKDFPDGVKSAVFKGNAEKWQVFTQVGYHGAKVILEPGRRYTSLDAMGLENPVKSMRKFTVEKAATVILYEDEGYGGKTQVLPEDSREFPELMDFPDGVKSAILKENATKWEVFTQVGYRGAKVILEPGRRYTSLDAMGLENPVKSMRRFIVTKAAPVIPHEDEGYGGKTQVRLKPKGFILKE